MALDLLLNLPTVLSCDILSSWLVVWNLAKLDSAYCNRENREKFLAMYGHEELVCSITECPRENIAWLLQRKIRLLDFHVLDQVPMDLALSYLECLGRFIQHVKLSNVSLDVARAIAQHCPNVTRLCLQSMLAAPFELLKAFHSIQTMYVFWSTFSETERGDDTLDLRNLKKLNIASFEKQSSDNIAVLLQKCPSLTHFALQGNRSLAPETLVSAILQLKNLISLTLGTLSIDDAALSKIVTHCTRIEDLRLHRCTSITDAAVHIVATTLKLKSISLPADARVTNRSLEHLGHCASTLEVLYIAQDDGLLQLSLPAVHSLLAKTRYCKYTWCTDILRNDCNFAFYGNATVVSFACAITDALLMQIAQHCKLLQKLDIYCSCEHIDSQYSSTGLHTVINDCPLLETISINPAVNIAGLDELMRRYNKLFTRSFLD